MSSSIVCRESRHQPRLVGRVRRRFLVCKHFHRKYAWGGFHGKGKKKSAVNVFYVSRGVKGGEGVAGFDGGDGGGAGSRPGKCLVKLRDARIRGAGLLHIHNTRPAVREIFCPRAYLARTRASAGRIAGDARVSQGTLRKRKLKCGIYSRLRYRNPSRESNLIKSRLITCDIPYELFSIHVFIPSSQTESYSRRSPRYA